LKNKRSEKSGNKKARRFMTGLFIKIKIFDYLAAGAFAEAAFVLVALVAVVFAGAAALVVPIPDTSLVSLDFL
jgi:hypothetical protein